MSYSKIQNSTFTCPVPLSASSTLTTYIPAEWSTTAWASFGLPVPLLSYRHYQHDPSHYQLLIMHHKYWWFSDVSGLLLWPQRIQSISKSSNELVLFLEVINDFTIKSKRIFKYSNLMERYYQIEKSLSMTFKFTLLLHFWCKGWRSELLSKD